MHTKTNKSGLVKLLLTMFTFIFGFSIFFFRCKKAELKEILPQNVSAAQPVVTSRCDSLVCEDCAFQETIENDTSEYPTVLGGTYSNPYSIQNMTQAYNLVHGTKLSAVSTTHYYVRFKPQSVSDLNKLDSLDLELFDYPLDRVVNQDGDYWPDAYVNLAAGEYPWLYTVVPSGFQFPTGVTYQNLALLNIPDDDAALEDEAFALTGNLDCGSSAAKNQGQTTNTPASSSRAVTPYILNCSPGYHWDFTVNKCVADNCPPGYHWDPSQNACVPDPPSPPSGNLKPQGMITYQTYNDHGIIPALAPLKYTRIVARRYLKIDKTYTDANGNFKLSKRFPHKVTIVVKFKTSSFSVRQTHTRYGVWRNWFAMKKNIGTYKGNNLQNLGYVFERATDSKKMRTRRWLAAITINTTLEARSFLSSNNLIQLPDRFPIYLIPPSGQALGETPQYEFIRDSYFDGYTSVHLEWTTTNINSLSASKISINVAQQLGLVYLGMVNEASHDDVNSYYSYVSAFNYAYGNNVNNMDPRYYPFGTGVSNQYYNGDVVAMWQSFAQHFGHTMANRIYGTGQSSFVLQGKTWSSSSTVSASSKYLEGFDPTIGEPNELFKWIPVGLINDLMDTQPDTPPLVDNVSGFTYSDMQSAYYTEPYSMLALKTALKNIKPSQAAAIDQLFKSYGY